MKSDKNIYSFSIPSHKTDLILAIERAENGEYGSKSQLVQDALECFLEIREQYGEDWRIMIKNVEPLWLTRFKQELKGARIVYADDSETSIEEIEEKLDLGENLK